MHKMFQSISKFNVLAIAAILCLLLNSCATILLNKHTTINIKSDLDSVRFAVLPDTTKWHSAPKIIIVKRSAKPVKIVAQKDTSKHTFTIKSRTSNLLYLNLILPQSWIGAIVDRVNDKCHDYPSTYKINMTDTAKTKFTFAAKPLPPVKNSTIIKLIFPLINGLILDSSGHAISRGGAFGLGIGIDYYFNKKYCLQANTGILSATIPVENLEGANDRAYASYATLELGSYFKDFQFSAGLQYMATKYYYSEYYKNAVNPYQYSTSTLSNTFGLAFTGQYKFWEVFTLDFRYYPSIFLWNEYATKFRYGHLISLGGSVQLEVFRPKKSRLNYKL
jgi:hypothetical protein